MITESWLSQNWALKNLRSIITAQTDIKKKTNIPFISAFSKSLLCNNNNDVIITTTDKEYEGNNIIYIYSIP